MGGTMDYPRFRNRNGLTSRGPIDVNNPYDTNLNIDPNLSMKIGDLNRMERDILGLNDSGGDPDREAKSCEKVTGVSITDIRKVMRWFLGYPEPYCEDCLHKMNQAGLTSTHWRCNKHAYGENNE